MSTKLYFPTGLSVERAKKDAKKYAKEHGSRLSSALDYIAMANFMLP